MGAKVDYVRKKYEPMKSKTLRSRLAHTIQHQFPRIGGNRIADLCAEMVLEVVDDHQRSRDLLTHGQVLWQGYAIDDPPTRHKTTARTKMVTVILDLTTPEDLDARIDRETARLRNQRKAVRLCRQAYEQGALLSNCDLAELMTSGDAYIASLLADHEKETGELIPRRATLHDMGSGLTHKRMICMKRYVEGKTSDVIARETHHSMGAVDRYLGQYDRVRQCRRRGMDVRQIAYTLNCSLALVREYVDIDLQLQPQAFADQSHTANKDNTGTCKTI
jgi:DNA-binding NarL/FixJ family response regulator